MMRPLLAACLFVCAAAQPSMGPKDKALCPVTGANITISASTPYVNLTYGQKIFFSSDDAVAKVLQLNKHAAQMLGLIL